MPGVTMSGLSVSPPRELHQPSRSGPVAPNCNGVNAAGYMAPTVSARGAEAGRPMVSVPGPSLPALIAKTTPGCASRNASTRESITAAPGSMLPTPNDMLSTSGSRRSAAKRAAYSIARIIEPVVEMPPRASLAILRAMIWAPGATPSNPCTP